MKRFFYFFFFLSKFVFLNMMSLTDNGTGFMMGRTVERKLVNRTSGNTENDLEDKNDEPMENYGKVLNFPKRPIIESNDI